MTEKKPRTSTTDEEEKDKNMDEETKERAHDFDYDQPIYEDSIDNSKKDDE